VFYYDYKNQQVQSAIYTAFGPIGNIVNANAHIVGAELEVEWQPTEALRITQSLAYKKGIFDTFQDLDITASTAAGHAVYVSRAGENEGFPPLSYQGSGLYTFALGGYRLDAEANYSYHDKYRPVLLGPVYNIDAYWLANANLTLSPKSGHWSVGVFVRNLFDTRYDLTRNFFLPPISIAAPGEPLTFGVRASVRL
jgi:outer membrane receptor protein involved in Fe transport